MSDADTVKLRTAIGEVLGGYGIDVKRRHHAHQPAHRLRGVTRGAGLAAVQRAEEQEQHALEVLRQADRDERTRRRIAAQREAIELEAANEATWPAAGSPPARLPGRPQRDVHTAPRRRPRARRQHRAMVQVGLADDIAAAMLMHTLPDDGVSAAPTGERPRSRSGPAAGNT